MASREDEWLWGWDPTPGIVSVWAEADGSAVVWRRLPETGELAAGRWRLHLPRVSIQEMRVVELEKAFSRRRKSTG